MELLSPARAPSVPIIDLENKFFQRTNIAGTPWNQLDQSFDPETSKAPSRAQDGMKAKEGGHLSLIYLTFISAKIRRVLASVEAARSVWQMQDYLAPMQSLHTSMCSKLRKKT